METRKRIAVKGFGLFLVFMAVCTVISKGIYRAGLPQVTVQVPYSSNLIHEIKAKGVVKQGTEYGVFTENGLRVAILEVREGQYFEEGAHLFQIDVIDLQDIIREKQLEIEKMKNIRRGKIQSDHNRKQKQQITIARIKEDSAASEADADLEIARCRQDLENAEQALARYTAYLNRMTQAEADGSGGDIRNDTEKYDWQERKNQLLINIQTCVQKLEDAERKKAADRKEASRAIADAESEEMVFDEMNENNELEIAFCENRLERLEELLKADGWIYSEFAGRVIKSNVSVGQRTQDGASILYAVDDGEKIIEAFFPEETGRYLTPDMELTVKANLPDGTPLNGIAMIEYLKELENGDVLAEMSGTGMEISIGQTVEVRCQVPTDNYAICISKLSVHEDEQGNVYVYVAEEREGILGIEWKVRKVSVTVKDQTDTLVAIECEEIGEDSKIVLTASDSLTDGAVVRLLHNF